SFAARIRDRGHIPTLPNRWPQQQDYGRKGLKQGKTGARGLSKQRLWAGRGWDSSTGRGIVSIVAPHVAGAVFVVLWLMALAPAATSTGGFVAPVRRSCLKLDE